MQIFLIRKNNLWSFCFFSSEMDWTLDRKIVREPKIFSLSRKCTDKIAVFIVFLRHTTTKFNIKAKF